MAKVGTIVVALGSLLIGLAAFEAEARACGGCFTPTDNPTVVTDHRMIMTITPTESTLYDQIKYTGDPASFAWVLPYGGEIKVGLSADIVFSSLDSLTQTTILPPPGCGNYGGFAGGASGGSSGSSSGGTSGSTSGGVTVLKHEVVGPYDTVQLAATNPKALEEWLQTNHFDIPADVKPVVDQYVNEKFNFLALKLVPDKGIQDMRPVRVTTKGANVALPLRMVAAGTGAKVGISLWVISEGRYEPQNYGSYIVNDNDLGWDVNNAKSNYTDLRAALNAKGNNSVWEIESSTFLNGSQFESLVRYGSGYYSGSSSGSSGYPADAESQAQLDYLPVKDANGNVTKTAVDVRNEDLDLLLPADAATRVTRMRADLAHAALTRDLVLTASPDQSLLSNTHQLFRCGLPSDPNSTVIHPGDVNAPVPSLTPPPDDRVSVGGGAGGCTTSAGPDRTFRTIGLSVLALAIARMIRRRRPSAA